MRAWSVCAEPGCGEATQRSRCPDHTRQRERTRGSRQARGYDRTHELLRAQWKTHVDTGTVTCPRCNQPIQPGTPWDLGHDDHDRSKYNGPEHASCNRAHRPTT